MKSKKGLLLSLLALAVALSFSSAVVAEELASECLAPTAPTNPWLATKCAVLTAEGFQVFGFDTSILVATLNVWNPFVEDSKKAEHWYMMTWNMLQMRYNRSQAQQLKEQKNILPGD